MVRGTNSDKCQSQFATSRSDSKTQATQYHRTFHMKATMKKYETLFHRHSANPILTGKDWPYSINSVFNAGATLLPDGSTLLLCRVEDRRGLSHLCVARSTNGVDGWQIDREPTLLPDPDKFPEEFGASKIRASPMCRSSRNMPSPTLPIPAAVLEFRSRSPKIFGASNESA